jgi:hypothetical protein
VLRQRVASKPKLTVAVHLLPGRGQEQGQRPSPYSSNDKSEIEFYDEWVRIPYDSNDPRYIRSQIRAKIKRTSVTVCMISEYTDTRVSRTATRSLHGIEGATRRLRPSRDGATVETAAMGMGL